MSLYVSGVLEGTKNVQIRSTDVDADADRRTTGSDSTTGVDINWSSSNGSVDSTDRNIIGQHLDHWHRNALHGGMVQTTDLCDACVQGQVNTHGGGQLDWSPSGRMLAYTAFVAAPNNGTACKVFISYSDSLKGRRVQITSVPVADHDYDPSWSPYDDALVFDRHDTYVIRRGFPWRSSSAMR